MLTEIVLRKVELLQETELAQLFRDWACAGEGHQ